MPAAEPRPTAWSFFGVRDSFAVYAVRYWLTDLAVDDGPDSAVRTRVYFALQRAGIPLSIPAHAVFVTDDARSARRASAGEELAAGARRCGASTSSRLPDDDRERLAEQLRHALRRGEAVTREGDEDDGLYMIVRGEAAVRIGGARGSARWRASAPAASSARCR